MLPGAVLGQRAEQWPRLKNGLRRRGTCLELLGRAVVVTSLTSLLLRMRLLDFCSPRWLYVRWWQWNLKIVSGVSRIKSLQLNGPLGTVKISREASIPELGSGPLLRPGIYWCFGLTALSAGKGSFLLSIDTKLREIFLKDLFLLIYLLVWLHVCVCTSRNTPWIRRYPPDQEVVSNPLKLGWAPSRGWELKSGLLQEQEVIFTRGHL